MFNALTEMETATEQVAEYLKALLHEALSDQTLK